MTSSLPRMRSTTELREPTCVTRSGHRGGGNRTPNRRFWRPVLCQLSYAPSYGWGRNRTADTRVFSAVLYRLSYPADSSEPSIASAAVSSGGGIRTHDLVVNSHPLWPLSYPGMSKRPSRRRRCRERDGPARKKRPARRDARQGLDSGGGIRTRDLRVMSPTSYQTAPPRNECPIVSATPDCVNRLSARKRRLAAPQAKIRRLPAPGAASTLTA